MHEILRLLGGSNINSISVSLFDAAQFVIVLATYPVLAASGTRSAQYFYALAESNKMLIIKLEGSNVENAKASLQDSFADDAQARDGKTGSRVGKVGRHESVGGLATGHMQRWPSNK